MTPAPHLSRSFRSWRAREPQENPLLGIPVGARATPPRHGGPSQRARGQDICGGGGPNTSTSRVPGQHCGLRRLESTATHRRCSERDAAKSRAAVDVLTAHRAAGRDGRDRSRLRCHLRSDPPAVQCTARVLGSQLTFSDTSPMRTAYLAVRAHVSNFRRCARFREARSGDSEAREAGYGLEETDTPRESPGHVRFGIVVGWPCSPLGSQLRYSVLNSAEVSYSLTSAPVSSASRPWPMSQSAFSCQTSALWSPTMPESAGMSSSFWTVLT